MSKKKKIGLGIGIAVAAIGAALGGGYFLGKRKKYSNSDLDTGFDSEDLYTNLDLDGIEINPSDGDSTDRAD